MDQASFMRRAISLSMDNVTAGSGGPFGAVIVRDGRIVGEGTNLVTASCDPTAHAEVVAIRLACQRLETFSLAGCELYASCEPCPMCLSAIYWARIDRIYFGNTKQDAAAIGFDDDFLYGEIALPPSQRTIMSQQILAKEAIEAFRAWDSSASKVPY